MLTLTEPYWSDAYQYSLGKPIEISNTTYKPCIIICCYGTLRVEACHRACLDLIVPRPSRYLRVAQRSYDATPSSQLARQRRLRDSAASQLSVTPPLAAEIIRELAQYLTSQFAALSLRSLNVNAPFLCLIDTSAPLTQRYAPFETRKYLSSVVNNGQRKEDDPLPQALYVAGNEFGITSFLIGTDGHAPEIDEVPGILWTTIVLRGPSYDLALQSDVSTHMAKSAHEQTWLTHSSRGISSAMCSIGVLRRRGSLPGRFHELLPSWGDRIHGRTFCEASDRSR